MGDSQGTRRRVKDHQDPGERIQQSKGAYIKTDSKGKTFNRKGG